MDGKLENKKLVLYDAKGVRFEFWTVFPLDKDCEGRCGRKATHSLKCYTGISPEPDYKYFCEDGEKELEMIRIQEKQKELLSKQEKPQEVDNDLSSMFA